MEPQRMATQPSTLSPHEVTPHQGPAAAARSTPGVRELRRLTNTFSG
jgi:hypothetical protein